MANSTPSMDPLEICRPDRSQRRPQKACVICNKRKIRCDLREDGSACSNCVAQNATCTPHKRRRRHITATSHRIPSVLRPHPPNQREPEIESGLRLASSLKGIECHGFHNGTTLSSSSVDKSTFDTRSPPDLVRNTNSSRDPTSPALLVTNRCGFIGHPELVADSIETEIVSDPVPPPPPRSLRSATDTAVLRLYTALDLPSRAVRDSLISNFTTYCRPWMPIVEASELKTLGISVGESIQGQDGSSSLLLAQAVFVAGSRVHSPRFSFASCSEFYDRAKALFFAEHETNSFTIIRALSLLQWYNPSGPEFVSIHSSGFWLRTAVGLAYQIGLHREPDPRKADYAARRRLFWTLYCRDCILSTAHGRPRAINLDDCNIRWPTVHDFPSNEGKHARFFLAYVEICTILGRLGRASLPDGHLRSHRADISGSLYRWISQLPPELQLTAGADFDLEVRQLHLLYFTSISILYGLGSSTDTCSAASILASSCVARTFEDFLARDMLRFLIPTVPYILLVAGLSQIACYKIPALSDLAKSEFSTIRSALMELGKIWHSARQKLYILDRLLAASHNNSRANRVSIKQLEVLPEHLSFFEMLPRELCPKLDIMMSNNFEEHPGTSSGRALARPLSKDVRHSLVASDYHNSLNIATSSTTLEAKRSDCQGESAETRSVVPEADWMFPDVYNYYEDQNGLLGSSGSWLLQEWEADLLRFDTL